MDEVTKRDVIKAIQNEVPGIFSKDDIEHAIVVREQVEKLMGNDLDGRMFAVMQMTGQVDFDIYVAVKAAFLDGFDTALKYAREGKVDDLLKLYQ